MITDTKFKIKELSWAVNVEVDLEKKESLLVIVTKRKMIINSS